MARGPHCGQYSIEKGGSQEGIKKWGKERERERERGGAIWVYA